MNASIRTRVLLGIVVAVVAGTWRAHPANTEIVKTITHATLEEPNQKTSEVSTDSHIPGALNVRGQPGRPMSQYVPDAGAIIRALGGDKTSPVVLYCSGPFCGRSKRLSEELLAAGLTNVRRYQLGIPVWRALGGSTQIELEAMSYVHEMDRSAVFIDAREPKEFQKGTLPRAVSVPASQLERGKDVGEVRRAKDDGRLPMEDHNTRIVVFGRDGEQARAVAEAIIGEAFHNVAFYGGTFESLRPLVKQRARAFIISLQRGHPNGTPAEAAAQSSGHEAWPQTYLMNTAAAGE